MAQHISEPVWTIDFTDRGTIDEVGKVAQGSAEHGLIRIVSGAEAGVATIVRFDKRCRITPNRGEPFYLDAKVLLAHLDELPIPKFGRLDTVLLASGEAVEVSDVEMRDDRFRYRVRRPDESDVWVDEDALRASADD